MALNFKKLISPNGTAKIFTNGTHDVFDKKDVYVEVKDSSAKIVILGGWQGTTIPVGTTFTVPACPQTEEEILISTFQGEGLYCNPNLTIDEVIELLERVFENNPSNNLYVPLNYSFLEFGTNLIITKSDAGFTVKLIVLGLSEDILIENSQFTNAYQTLVIEFAEQFGKPANFIKTLMYSYVQNTEPVSVTCETTYNETNVGEYNELLKDWISYLPFTQVEGKSISLSGEYDGKDVNVTENGIVDIEGMIGEHKIPLKVNVEIGEGWERVIKECSPIASGQIEFYASNGRDIYVSGYSSTLVGIYYTNLETGTLTKIYDYGSDWIFYEDKNNNIYATSSHSTIIINQQNYNVLCNGRVYFLGETETDFFVKQDKTIYTIKNNSLQTYYVSSFSLGSYCYVSKKGEVYLYDYSNSLGIQYLHNGEVLKTNISDKNLKFMVELDNGDVYFTSDNGDSGVYRVQNGVSETVIPTGYDLSYYFVASDGSLYIGSYRTNQGLYRVRDRLCVTLDLEAPCTKFFEDVSGQIYGYYKKIYKLNEENVETIFEGTYELASPQLKSKLGYYYLWSTSSGLQGMLYVKDGVATKIMTSGYNFKYVISDDGEIYTNYNRLYLISEDVATQISTTSISSLYKDSNGEIYGGRGANNSGIYHIKGTTVTNVSSMGYCVYFHEIKGVTYCSQYQMPENKKTIFKLNGNQPAQELIYIKEK